MKNKKNVNGIIKNFKNYYIKNLIVPVLIGVCTYAFASFLDKNNEIETREFKIRFDLYTDFITAYNTYINNFKLLNNYELEYKSILINKGISENNILECIYNKPLNCTFDKNIAYIIGESQNEAYRNTINNIEKEFKLSFLKFNLLVDEFTSNKIKGLILTTLYVEPNNYNGCDGENSPICGFNFSLHNRISTENLDFEIISILRKDLINY